MRYGGSYSELLPHDSLNILGDQLSHTGSVLPKQSVADQVGEATIVIASNLLFGYVFIYELCEFL